MKPTRKVSRRSFFAAMGGSTVAGGALALLAPEAVAFQTACSGYNDTDTGPNADHTGCGRGRGTRPNAQPRSSGVTDNDVGSNSDPVGHGRGGGTGITDSDRGTGADPAGRGRGTSAPAPAPAPAPYTASECDFARRNLAMIDEDIAAGLDDDQFAALEADYRRLRELGAEIYRLEHEDRGWFASARGIWLSHEVSSIGSRYKADCNWGTHSCIDLVGQRYSAARSARERRPDLEMQRARLVARIGHNCR